MKGAVPLLLLAVFGANAVPSAEECAGLTKRLPTTDLHKIFGHWILEWGVTDHADGQILLGSLISSYVNFKLLPDNITIVHNERNMFPGNPFSCTTYFINITSPNENSTQPLTLSSDFIRLEKNGVIQEYNDTGVEDFYQTCTNCLLTTYTNLSHRYLLSYKKEGSHGDVEQMKAAQENLRKMAECLGFPHDKPYIYDGVADFCHKTSAAVAHSRS